MATHYNDLDDGESAYIECALWSSTDNADDSGGEPLDKNYGPEDFDDASLRGLLADWARFYEANRDDIGHEIEKAAHDLWLTRNGHGSGFWDREDAEYGSAEARDRLDAASRKFGEVDIYVGDDGKLYT